MAAAGDADILFQAESSTLKGYLTVWMTSFEKNVGKASIFYYLFYFIIYSLFEQFNL